MGGTPLGQGKGPPNPSCSRGRTQRPLFLRPSRPRQKIFKERALPDIENYMFENHDQLRQAATECMCNMVLHKEVWGQRGGGGWGGGSGPRPWCQAGAVVTAFGWHSHQRTRNPRSSLDDGP